MPHIDLKKKVGPLPVWGWALLGTGTLGVAYYLHARSASSPTAATTAADTAAQQQAAAADQGVPYYDSGSGGGSGGGSTGSTSSQDSATLTDIDSQLQGVNANLAALSAGQLTDTGAPSLTQEVNDVAGAVAALQSAGLLGTASAAPKGSSPVAKGKSVAGLPILAQLEDLKAGLVNKTALGPNATKQLATVGGNVNKAITARQSAIKAVPKKPTTPPKSIANRPR